MTTEDVAEFFQVPKNTIYAWRSRDVGPPAIKVGRHLRWRREDVEAWVREHADEPAVPA